MTREEFFEKFELFAELPGAVDTMRELVLAWAVEGRLVRQDPSEEPAVEQLARIETAVADRGRDVRSARSFLPHFDDREPPHGWAVVQLAKLVRVLNGRAYAKSELLPSGRTPVLRVGNLFTSRDWYYSDLILEDDKYCDEGDLIYAWSASFGPFIWSGPQVIYHYHIWKLALHSEEEVDKRYLFWFLHERTSEIKRAGHGVSMTHMTKEKIDRLEIGLPPLAEQKRIVAKVDELMALCDQLEAQQKEGETRHAALARASISRFLDAPTSTNLLFLFHKSYAVEPDDIRRSILWLAIRGRLVSLDSGEKPPEVTFPNLARAAIDYRDDGYPPAWMRVRLGDVGDWMGGGTPSKSRPDFWIGNLPWVSPKDMKVLHISDAQDHISTSAVENSSVRLIPPGSVLMVVRGMILDRAFPVALTTREVTINQDMKALLPAEPATREYLLLALRALEHDVLRAVERSSHGTCKLKTEFLKNLVIPFPSLAEQRRIITKVDRLITSVNEWEKQLALSRVVAEKLLKTTSEELIA